MPMNRNNPRPRIGSGVCQRLFRKRDQMGPLSVFLFAALLGCSSSPEASPSPPKSEPGLQAFQSSVYPYLRTHCASCHATRAPQIAAKDVNQAYQATRPLVEFAAVQNSRLVTKAQDRHCGPTCSGDVGELVSALKTWAAHESSGMH